jgi:hypothetical protein
LEQKQNCDIVKLPTQHYGSGTCVKHLAKVGALVGFYGCVLRLFTQPNHPETQPQTYLFADQNTLLAAYARGIIADVIGVAGNKKGSRMACGLRLSSWRKQAVAPESPIDANMDAAIDKGIDVPLTSQCDNQVDSEPMG